MINNFDKKHLILFHTIFFSQKINNFYSIMLLLPFDTMVSTNAKVIMLYKKYHQNKNKSQACTKLLYHFF